MCAGANDPEMQALIAADTCFACGQCAKFFLRDDALFLDVVGWMFSLLSSCVQDVHGIALECMRTLVKNCHDQMVRPILDKPPILDRIVTDFGTFVSGLNEEAAATLFEITSHLIAKHNDEVVRRNMADVLIGFLSEQLNSILGSFSALDRGKCHKFVFILRCNKGIASQLGNIYIHYFLTLFPDLISLYTSMTKDVSQLIVQPSKALAVPPIMLVIESIVSLVESAVYYTYQSDLVREKIIPLCLEKILSVFGEAPPGAKCSKVLSLFGVLASRFSREVANKWGDIFSVLYHPVLDMIKDDFVKFEGFRPQFFSFMGTIIRALPGFVLSLSQDDLNVFVESLKWGANHPQTHISEKATSLLQEFVAMMGKKLESDVVGQFTERYGVPLFLFALRLMTDTVHKFAFAYQVDLIRGVFGLPHIKDFAYQMMRGMMEAFPDKNPQDLGAALGDMWVNAGQGCALNRTCKDFLIYVRHILPRDPDLMKDEKERLMAEWREKLKDVPGLAEPRNDELGGRYPIGGRMLSHEYEADVTPGYAMSELGV
jgi:hypothetical protein